MVDPQAEDIIWEAFNKIERFNEEVFHTLLSDLDSFFASAAKSKSKSKPGAHGKKK